MENHTITTEQLIHWAKAAHKKREDSWVEGERLNYVEGYYKVSQADAIASTCPIAPPLQQYFEVEFDLVKHMLNTWWRELEEIDNA